jgi:hypothetical protein
VLWIHPLAKHFRTIRNRVIYYPYERRSEIPQRRIHLQFDIRPSVSRDDGKPQPRIDEVHHWQICATFFSMFAASCIELTLIPSVAQLLIYQDCNEKVIPGRLAA